MEAASHRAASASAPKQIPPSFVPAGAFPCAAAFRTLGPAWPAMAGPSRAFRGAAGSDASPEWKEFPMYRLRNQLHRAQAALSRLLFVQVASAQRPAHGAWREVPCQGGARIWSFEPGRSIAPPIVDDRPSRRRLRIWKRISTLRCKLSVTRYRKASPNEEPLDGVPG